VESVSISEEDVMLFSRVLVLALSVTIHEEDEDEEETKMTKLWHIFYAQIWYFGMRMRREQISFISAVCSDVFWIILARTHDTHFYCLIKKSLLPSLTK